LGSPRTGWRLALRFTAVLVLLSVVPRSACGGPTQSIPAGSFLANPWIIPGEVETAVAVPVAVTSDDPGNGGWDWEEGDGPYEHPQISGAVFFDLPEAVHDEVPTWCKLRSSYTVTGGKTTAYLVFLEEMPVFPQPQYVAQPLLESTYAAAEMEAILIPVLVNLSSAEDLFVAVDLNEWLAAAPTLEIGNTVTVTSGEARELPGFLVGTVDIGLDPLTGFHSPSLFSGEVGVGGYYGLQVMPEPATVALLAMGGLALLGFPRRGK
jgi:hypothetical protein